MPEWRKGKGALEEGRGCVDMRNLVSYFYPYFPRMAENLKHKSQQVMDF